MSFDSTYIEILTRCGDDEQRRLAKKISWFVNRHHLTLVTLLLGNAACNEALPIGLNKIVDEVAAILISVTAVLIVGEIVPTAILTGPNQLKYAARLTTVVWILLLLVYPIAKPVAMLLDHWLGDDHGTRYRCVPFRPPLPWFPSRPLVRSLCIPIHSVGPRLRPPKNVELLRPLPVTTRSHPCPSR